jgi:hypothetical protein
VQSLRNRCAIAAETKRFLNRIAAHPQQILRSLWFALQSRRNRNCTQSHKLLCNRWIIAAQSLRSRCAIAAQSLCSRCAIVVQSLRKRNVSQMESLRTHSRYCVRCGLLCNRVGIAMQSLPQSDRNRILMLSYRCAIVVQSLRNRCDIARNRCGN